MKKIATKFVLVAASAFIFGTAMAQTDTTDTPAPVPDTTETPTPVPDTTETPTPTEPTDTTSVPDTTAVSVINSDSNTSIGVQLSKYNNNFYAITNRELLNVKQHDMKAEEENEA